MPDANPLLMFISGSCDSTSAIVGSVLGILLCVAVVIITLLVVKVRRLAAARGTIHKDVFNHLKSIFTSCRPDAAFPTLFCVRCNITFHTRRCLDVKNSVN